MKICPTCSNKFEDSVDFCPKDGEVLVYDLSALVGQTLDGQYRIEALLGGGGMGAVYRARHIMLGDQVAVKVIRPDIGRSPDFLRRFRREGQAARKFHHPNSITVHDLRTTTDGLTYMVLEYIDGRTLREELDKRGRFSVREAFDILEPVANALNEAHAVGVVHRDLKPDNIMIGNSATGRNVVKVLDLGLAKIRQTPDMSGTALTALTVGGQVLGTPSYMPPEQWDASSEDGAIDGRADIYSLGIVFYEMISGYKPFKGNSMQELAREHAVVNPKPLNLIRPEVPEGFARAVTRAMAKERDERYATVAEFANDLRTALADAPNSDKPSSWDSDETVRFSSPNLAVDTLPKKTVDTVQNKPAQTVHDQIEEKIPEKTEKIDPVPLPRSAWTGVVVGVVFAVILSLGGLVVWKRFSPQPVDINNHISSTSPAETVEMMRYWLETTSPIKGGPSVRAAGPVVLEQGQGFQFHFSAREFGYLYIIGKGKGNAPTLFLTAKPPASAGVKTNSIKVGEDYHFPSGETWIEFDKNSGTEKYTIIYSPAPLNSPSFLGKESDRELTPEEHKEWEEFRAKTLTAATNITTGQEPSVTVLLPKAKADGQTFIFDVNIEHK